MNKSLAKLLVLVLLALTASAINMEEHEMEVVDHQAIADHHTFCWKDTFGRGVGSIPDQCGDRAKIGLLCYSHCPAGYYRWGFDCHTYCPNGWRDDGLFCRLAEYWRNGYPWRGGDWLFNLGQARDRCQAGEHTACEQWGAIYYPVCRNGFYPVGCCICRPHVPNCGAYGLNNGIDLSCAKRIIIGDPVPMSCAGGLEYNGGLCYHPCRSGYTGVGPVCWAHPPAGWVDCGAGAAKDTATCAEVIKDQVMSVAESAISIVGLVASLGSSAAAAPAAKAATSSTKIASIISKMKKIKDAVKSSSSIQKIVTKAKKINDKLEVLTENKFKKAYDFYGQAKTVSSTVQSLEGDDFNQYTPADYARMAASIASLIDPSGIAGVVSSYAYDLCSTINK